jgi:membrane-associated phospholipid phosphatase
VSESPAELVGAPRARRMFGTPDRRAAWKAFGVWVLWGGLAFVAVYPGCNWLGDRRARLFDLYVDPELAAPFVPRFIWAYLSMYALFFAPPFFLDPARMRTLGRRVVAATLFSGAVFLLLPARLGFTRVVPADPFYAALYSGLFAIDAPHNLVPSLHVGLSALIVLSVSDAVASARLKTFFFAWLALIAASTVLVHQHHLLDVGSGLVVALACRRWIPDENERA